MFLHVTILHKQPRVWTKWDIFCAYLSGLIMYALSPPWIIALFRVCGAPLWLLNSLAILYSPLSVARQNLTAIDAFYDAYRILLSPWLSGI